MGILDIKSGDISALSPGDLQELVGRLSQAELMKRGLPPTGATWGGNINTRDGGVDVLVDTDARISESGFIPKGVTAFQVKQTEMGVAKVGGEMLDGKGRLKQAIAEVFQGGGAYIVVSGKDSAPPLGPVGIDERKQSMRKAAKDYPNGFVDFYGNDRIAQWVRCHSSLASWVREQKREARYGWKPYGDWSYPPLGDTDAGTYITQKGMVLLDRVRKEPLPIVEAINALRKTMRERALPVRIVGLAGTGKTRLMQALFDSKVGEAPLNKYEVVYADSGTSPEPSPVHFAEVLAAKQDFVVLIVDNCSRELHDKLAVVCRAKGSRVKLVTVDLDVRQDIPLETDAFELICEKGEMVMDLLNRRCEDVNQVNKETINRLCGGNARMALILADAVQRVGSANVNDENFLDCLFWQRQEVDKELKQTAEVCSLLYSFGVAGDAAGELEMLASLVGRTPESLFDDVGKLVGRGIAQARGNMRAILPEALANRFAADALKRISDERIVSAVTELSADTKFGGRTVLGSFSRRLGDMHESAEAQKIAKKWLAPGGLLDAQGKHPSRLQMAVLENIAPVLPERTLEFISRAATGGTLSAEFPYLDEYARLLFHLAYDKNLFNDAAGLLVRIALLASDYHTSEYAQGILCTLFYYSLSGTHASFAQRMAFVEKMTEADDRKEWQLGLKLLASTMTGSRSNSGLLLAGFGARPRDFGRNIRGAEAREWFGMFIDHTAKLAISGKPVAQEALHLLVEQFRELWGFGLEKELTSAADKIAAHDEQHEMAIAVLEAIRYDGDEMKPESLAQLQKIQKSLIPKEDDIRGRFKMFFVADSKGHHLLSNTDLDGQDITPAKAEEYARKMGVDIMRSASDFKALLPDMLTASHHSLSQLGRGIADGCDGNYQRVWGDFREHLRVIPKDKFNVSVPAGFVSGVAKKSQSDAIDILNRSVKDDALAPFYLHLEPFTERLEGAKCRIKQSIGLGKVPPRKYKFLAWGRSHDAFNDADLAEIIRLITPLPGGMDAAVEILSMRFYDIREGQYTPDDSIRKCGREVVLGVDFSARDGSGMKSHSAGRIVEVCFSPPGAEEDRKQLRRTLAREIKRGNLSGNHKILKLLAKWDPAGFLDDFLIVDDAYNLHPLRAHVGGIAEDVINWCQQNPVERCPRAAFVVQFLQSVKGEGRALTSVAQRLVDMVDDDHDKMKVLNNLWRGGNSQSCFVGSHVQMLEERLVLFAEFSNHSVPAVAEWARRRAESTKKGIEEAREQENQENASASQGFE